MWEALAAVAALGVGATMAQRRHVRRIARDPEQAALREPVSGRPVSVRSADGTGLHVEEFGPEGGGGAIVVLAHGWTESLSFWMYVIRELSARGTRVIAYDLRGHGSSEPAADDDYSVVRFGEDLEAVLAACVTDGQRAVVAGHSLGAMSIVAWAERFEVSSRVGAALLANTGVGDLMAEQLLIPVPAIAQIANRLVRPDRVLASHAPLPRLSTPLSSAAVRYVAFGPAASPAQVAFYERMLVTCPPDARAQVGIALSEIDLYRALPRLTVPAVVLAGERDRLTPPSHARRIAEALPNLERLVVVPGCGHMGPLECHAEINELLVGLVARVNAAPGVPA